MCPDQPEIALFWIKWLFIKEFPQVIEVPLRVKNADFLPKKPLEHALF
jgi:hypothetical protein